MKVFDYKTPCSTSVIPYSEDVYLAAQEEAKKSKEIHNFVCEVSEPYDDGQPDPAATPSQLDVIEAQVAYTAMMTDTLLEV